MFVCVEVVSRGDKNVPGGRCRCRVPIQDGGATDVVARGKRHDGIKLSEHSVTLKIVRLVREQPLDLVRFIGEGQPFCPPRLGIQRTPIGGMQNGYSHHFFGFSQTSASALFVVSCDSASCANVALHFSQRQAKHCAAPDGISFQS